MNGFFDTRIEFLKGVGPAKSELLNKELGIFNFADFIQYYPFRYEDRTKYFKISQLSERESHVQIKGFFTRVEHVGFGRKKRLVARFKDDTGEIELVWFKGAQWIQKKIQPGVEYVVFGKPTKFGKNINIAHPELEFVSASKETKGFLQPVYSTTEKLKLRYLDSKAILKLQAVLLKEAHLHIRETLPQHLADAYNLMSKKDAMVQIHFPDDHDQLKKASFRLKFEELFYIQLQLLTMKVAKLNKFKGIVFNKTDIITRFYNDHIPFDLTSAQKKVIKEIYADMQSGHQMNRLLQGDVGSGKTIVSFLCMLLAINGNTQAALMAPTEILAIQHFHGLKPFVETMNLRIGLLTGSTKTRNTIQAQCSLQ